MELIYDIINYIIYAVGVIAIYLGVLILVIGGLMLLARWIKGKR